VLRIRRLTWGGDAFPRQGPSQELGALRIRHDPRLR
jgi:hypothetical protein